MNGELLKKWRQQKGLTRKEFGKQCGVSEHAVAKWEQGVYPVPPLVMKEISSLAQLAIPLPTMKNAFRISEETGRDVDSILVGALVKELGPKAPPRRRLRQNSMLPH